MSIYKRVQFNYYRDINSINKKELIRNLERINYNYQVALENYWKKNYTSQVIKAKIGGGEFEVSQKILYWKKKIKRGLRKYDLSHFKFFLTQMKRYTPRNEKSFGKISGDITRSAWDDYLSMVEKLETTGARNDLVALVKQLGFSEEDIREFLFSKDNVDLSFYEYETEGLIGFESEYGLSLPIARFLDHFGYDYVEYGMSGRLVPKS